MARLKKLTEPQKKLLDLIRIKRGEKNIFEYEEMKNKCIDEFKSFDNSFNALLFKGYLKHCPTTADKNTFVAAIK